MISTCIRCETSLPQTFHACSVCSPHITENVCEDCNVLERQLDHAGDKLAEYADMCLPEVRDRVVLKTCFRVLKQFATASKFAPGHVGYKRHRDDVMTRGGFARRSERIAMRQ